MIDINLDELPAYIEGLQAENGRLRELLLALANHLETEWLPIQHHQNEWADDYPETFALLQRVNEVAGEKP